MPRRTRFGYRLHALSKQGRDQAALVNASGQPHPACVLSSATHSAQDVIRLYQLEPLPHEGGWYRRLAQSAQPATTPSPTTLEPALGGMPAAAPRAWSSILALFTPGNFSALHRLASEEVWCFHAGDPLESLRLLPDGRGEWIQLGLNRAAGQRAQDAIAARVWQGTRVVAAGKWALVSCIVVPEFTWQQFELARRDSLLKVYPQFRDGICALTRR